MVLATVGCAGKDLAIPERFCEVPVAESALSPLVPEGEDLEVEYNELKAQSGAACSLTVDNQSVLAVNLQYWDRPPDPVNWKAVASTSKNAKKRGVSFMGDAVIGSDHAVVQAKCDSPKAYMSFVFHFRGDRVEDAPGGFRKLQRFIDDFVPAETKRFKCTD